MPVDIAEQVRDVAVARRQDVRETVRAAIEHALLNQGPLADEDVLADPFVGLSIGLAVDAVCASAMRVWQVRLERLARIGKFTIVSGGRAS